MSNYLNLSIKEIHELLKKKEIRTMKKANTNVTENKVNEREVMNMNETRIVYKKVRALKDGKYYPLFIDNKKPFEFGEWMRSEYHPTKGFAPRSINGTDNEAPIGGWHSCPLPEASWIADQLKSGEKRVWMECEAMNVVEYERPQGIWFLSEWLKPIRILTEDEILELTRKAV